MKRNAKKLLGRWVCLILLTLLFAVLASCGKSDKPNYEEKASVGLSFTSNGDGTCYVSGIGDCTDTDIVIPKTSPDGEKVTSIGENAFNCCTSLESITIPDSVTTIGSSAFSGCTSLTNITIPDSVTSIGSGAFYNTAYYNNDANWTDGVLYIGNRLIEAKTDISGAYTIKDGTKCIADYAFSYCKSLTSIIIPDSVTSICGGAFEGCTRLETIVIPDNVKSIQTYAFYNCASLEKVYYKGSADDWSSISIDESYDGNSYLTSATRYYYSEVELTTSGRYWHYDENGNVTEW